MLQCPYCLEQVEARTETQGNTTFYVCSNEQCNQRLAREYVESPLPRTTIGIIGFSGHGKTSFLHSLFYVLNLMENVWSGYHSKSLDDETDHIIHTMVRHLQDEALLPESTAENFPRPALLLHNNIPVYGNWFITMYDTAGAVFEDVQKITDQGRYVAHAETVFFLVSLAVQSLEGKPVDRVMEESPGERLKFLLEKYLRAVQDHMRVDLKNQQNLVVVFTKADILRHGKNALTKELDTYLSTGSYLACRDLAQEGSTKRLQETSDRLEAWLKDRGCQGFISMARENFRNVALTVVSATGAATEGRNLGAAISPQSPKRMLDPFLWALEFAKSRVGQKTKPNDNLDKSWWEWIKQQRSWIFGIVIAVAIFLILIQSFMGGENNYLPAVVTRIFNTSLPPLPGPAGPAAEEARNVGMDLAGVTQKVPHMKQVLHEAQKLQAISPRYEEQVTIAKKVLKAAQDKKRQHIKAYSVKIQQLRRYSQSEIDAAMKSMKKSNPSKEQMIVAELMAKHLAALGENSVPKLDGWLLNFEQKFSKDL